MSLRIKQEAELSNQKLSERRNSENHVDHINQHEIRPIKFDIQSVDSNFDHKELQRFDSQEDMFLR